MSNIKALDELRDYSHLDDDKWTLETGEIIHMYGSKPNDPNAINWGEQWRKIADEIEQEIAERYMELPVDADGVPIHVGDELFNKNKPTDVYKVTAIADNGYLRIYHDTAHIHSSQCRHVKPRTLEDVLASYRFDAQNIYEDPMLNGNQRVDELEALDRKVAEEIRGMMA